MKVVCVCCLQLVFQASPKKKKEKKIVAIFIHQRSIKTHFQKAGREKNLNPLELYSKKRWVNAVEDPDNFLTILSLLAVVTT